MMKKTIVALAATAATAAFAQVSIVGNIDVGYQVINAQDTLTNVTRLTNNGVSTSTLAFKGSEDLGNGLKIGFSLETTINPTDSSTQDGAPGYSKAGSTGQTAASGAYTGTPFNSEQFISLSGDFGTVRAGVPNAAVFRAQGVSQPFGTGFGSGYSSTYSRMGTQSRYTIGNYLGGSQGAGNTLRVLRNERTVQYETPNMNGLSGMVEVAFANDNFTSAAATSDKTFANNTPAFMGVLVNYSAGDLNVSAAYNSIKSGYYALPTNQSALETLGAADIAANTEVNYSILAANYKIGASTFYAGATNVKASNNTEDAQSWNVAYKYAMNANVDFLANLVSKSSSLPTSLANTSAAPTSWNLNSKMIGIGADYRLSKRSNLYVRYENRDSNTDNAGTGETVVTMIGVRHQF